MNIRAMNMKKWVFWWKVIFKYLVYILLYTWWYRYLMWKKCILRKYRLMERLQNGFENKISLLVKNFSQVLVNGFLLKFLSTEITQRRLEVWCAKNRLFGNKIIWISMFTDINKNVQDHHFWMVKLLVD